MLNPWAPQRERLDEPLGRSLPNLMCGIGDPSRPYNCSNGMGIPKKSYFRGIFFLADNFRLSETRDPSVLKIGWRLLGGLVHATL